MCDLNFHILARKLCISTIIRFASYALTLYMSCLLRMQAGHWTFSMSAFFFFSLFKTFPMFVWGRNFHSLVVVFTCLCLGLSNLHLTLNFSPRLGQKIIPLTKFWDQYISKWFFRVDVSALTLPQAMPFALISLFRILLKMSRIFRYESGDKTPSLSMLKDKD